MADWANLPNELLSLIAQRFVLIDDFIVFGAVCKPWQSAIILEEKPSSPPKVPWLMLAEEKDKEDESSKGIPTRGFFNLFSAKICDFMLPETSGRKCLGTYFGWLLTIGFDLEIKLLHPFSRHQIRLPPQHTFTDQYSPKMKPEPLLRIFVMKVVLSSPPIEKINLPNDSEKQDCIIVAIYGEFRILAFARLGDNAWTNIKVPSRVYDDVVYYKGQFYAVDCHGVVVVCNIDDADEDPSATVIARAPVEEMDSIRKYLVESSGDLLLVLRIRRGWIYGTDDDSEPEEHCNDEKRIYYTVGFSILKMEECGEEGSEYSYKWVQVNGLGNRALFLGNNLSVSLSASDYINGCIKPNCIYFTDDNLECYPKNTGGGYDMGIFNIKDGTIEPHYTGHSRCLHTPPLWYI